MLKILSGKFKGKKLASPKTDTTRPTSSMARAAVFNILRPTIEDLSFLDLCAGSGAMGFEALSEGASKVGFVEKNSSAIKAILTSARELNVEPQIRLYSYDLKLAFQKINKDETCYDIVFSDPPYKDTHLLDLIFEFFAHSSKVQAEALLILETKKKALQTIPSFVTLESQRSFGNTEISIFKKKTCTS